MEGKTLTSMMDIVGRTTGGTYEARDDLRSERLLRKSETKRLQGKRRRDRLSV